MQLCLVFIIVVIAIFSTSSSDEGVIGSSSTNQNMKIKPKKAKIWFVFAALFMINSLLIAKANVKKSAVTIQLLEQASKDSFEHIESVDSVAAGD
ncbi:hypothetical protein [Candidatus Cyrtobacter comes]|nr:hypothetical protein [Candidatus Cyrtobacter comes]